jgi:putative flippase GtrA
VLIRYLINGLAATAIHFSVLWFNLRVLGLPSAGLANAIAALFGISASFLGSRHYVFQATAHPVSAQAWRFALLYGALALMHGLVLYFWTDRAGLDYRVGFLFATGMQMVCSYFGNRFLVFNK